MKDMLWSLSGHLPHHVKTSKGLVGTFGFVRAGPQNITVSFDVMLLLSTVLFRKTMWIL